MLAVAPLQAQVRPPGDTTRAPARAPGDTSRAPAVPMGDSLAADSIPKDAVKSPLAVAPRPAVPEIRGRRTIWDRAAIFASGAITLPELLAQVPGVDVFNAGFIAAPTVSSWYGQPGRVRVYLDGVELDALDPREGGVRDLAVLQMWTLEEVAVERAAGELRVFLRSWRVERTTAQTRTDILTGSEQANLYRGFYGKRTNSGGVVQLAAQQYSTTSQRTAGDGDALAAFGRLGFARGRLTVDAVATRFGRNRASTYRYVVQGTLNQNAIGSFEGSDATGYLRAAWGDADRSGFWMQGLVARSIHRETGDTVVGADSSRSQTQYIAMAGLTRWGARLSATARMRSNAGETRFSPSVRGSWERDWFAVSASAEEGGPDSTRRVDALAVLTPFKWLHFMGAHSIHTPDAATAYGPSRTTSRAEAAIQLFGRWIGAGAVQRSAMRLQGMRVFDTLYAAVDVPAATGLEATLGGPLAGSFSFEWRGVRWPDDVPYTPVVESHTEIRVSTDFHRQIKRRTFDLTAGLTHDYRGAMDVPVTGGGSQRAQGAGWVGGFVEMRIASAHIFWYNRNAAGKIYETVPGFMMPRLVQLYGVRWEFWN